MLAGTVTKHVKHGQFHSKTKISDQINADFYEAYKHGNKWLQTCDI